jgi:hypothetical protein
MSLKGSQQQQGHFVHVMVLPNHFQGTVIASRMHPFTYTRLCSQGWIDLQHGPQDFDIGIGFTS